MVRAAEPPLVNSSRCALASFAAKPAERTRRRQALASPDPADLRCSRSERCCRRSALPGDRDFAKFLDSDVGQNFLSGNWGWFGLILVLFVFNTVLGEELLFRGLLLPRMNRVFGRGDWAANGVLFAAYHMHMPWAMPATLLFDTFAIAYPTKRYQSAWIGIAVHSAQSVFVAAIILALVV